MPVELVSLATNFGTMLRDLSEDHQPRHMSEWFRFCMENYTHPDRHWHTTAVVKQVISDCIFIGGSNLTERQLNLLRFAAWFQYIHYTPGSTNGRVDSAEVAEKALVDINAAPETVNTVRNLILCNIIGSQTELEDIFWDANRAIFGMPWQRYINYATGIDVEHAAMPDDEWLKYRITWLNVLLEQSRSTGLYLTQKMSIYEDPAQKNILNEIQLLTARM